MVLGGFAILIHVNRLLFLERHDVAGLLTSSECWRIFHRVIILIQLIEVVFDLDVHPKVVHFILEQLRARSLVHHQLLLVLGLGKRGRHDFGIVVFRRLLAVLTVFSREVVRSRGQKLLGQLLLGQRLLHKPRRSRELVLFGLQGLIDLAVDDPVLRKFGMFIRDFADKLVISYS